MGSFSSVNNLRASLTHRWRHSVYRFSADEIFKYWLNENISTRLANSGLSKKLGVYFSHFVFSEGPAWAHNGFFFDTRLDWRYRRFPNLVSSIYSQKERYIKPKSLRSVRRYLNSIKFSGIRSPAGLVLGIQFNSKFRNSSNIFVGYSRYGNLRISNMRCSCLQIGNHNNKRCLWFRILCSEVVTGLRYFAGSARTFNYNCFQSRFQFLKYSIRSRKLSSRSEFSSKVFRVLPRFHLRLAFLRRISNWGWRRLTSWVSKFRVFFTKVPESFKVLPFIGQFRVILVTSLRFFFSYYFRYYPLRFLQILQSGAFLFSKKTLLPFYYSGYSPKWLRLSRKSISRWMFYMGYMYFFRFRAFFRLIQNLKVVSQLQLSNCFNNVQLVNLSKFGVLPSALISNIFAQRLRRRERVNPILYSLIRLVLSRKKVLGLVILRSGRFTKRQRAVRTPYRIGRVSYNSYIMPIDYSISTAILKYSLVAIKVWISTAPGVRFFRYMSAGNNCGLIYPSSLHEFSIKGYSCIWRVVNSFRYSFPTRSKYVNFRSFRSSSLICCSEFKFLPSWNFSCIRAYRRFSKLFAFSRYKYIGQNQSVFKAL